MHRLKELFAYLVGALLFGYTLSLLISWVLDYLAFTLLLCLILVPFYGILRMKYDKNLIGIKGIVIFLKKLNFGWGFYLIMGIALYFVHKEVAFLLAKASLVGAGGLLLTYAVWEATRLVLKRVKKVEIPTFLQAVKGAW